jgi:DNA-binding NarL/FixJ family response regulator
MREGESDTDHPLVSTLTPRERDVMDYVALGTPNKIIAAELGVSQRTVEAHRARIFQKLRVRNAVELARCLLAPQSPVRQTALARQH